MSHHFSSHGVAMTSTSKPPPCRTSAAMAVAFGPARDSRFWCALDVSGRRESRADEGSNWNSQTGLHLVLEENLQCWRHPMGGAEATAAMARFCPSPRGLSRCRETGWTFQRYRR